MSARENILGRIRARQRKPVEPGANELDAAREEIAAREAGERPAMDWDPAARFRDRALVQTCTIDEVSLASDAPAAVARYLDANRLPRVAACWNELANLPWQAAGMTVEAREARDADLVGITGAYCAIAETGTLVMLSGPGTPGSASLLPETHIAIVKRSRVVRGMEEAWALLRRERGELPRAVNLISGPSRTADIEQTVTLGAHGPYRVHIVIVAAAD